MFDVKDKKDYKIVRIQVSPDAKKAIKDFSDEMDMTDVGVASRVYEWFSKQPLYIRKWVAGLLEGDDSRGAFEFAKSILQDFNKPEGPETDRFKGSVSGGGKSRRV